MANSVKTSSKLAALIKKTAQKLVKNPKAIHKELKKLALTLPLMALLVEEVRAAQKKISIDAAPAPVFEDETALAEFIEAQNLDEAQYTEIAQELEGVLLAKADQAQEENDDKGALLERSETATGRGLAAETESEAATTAAGHAAAETESFELAGVVIPVAPGPLIGAVASGLGIVAAANTGNGGTAAASPKVEPATSSNLAKTLKQLKTAGIDFVQPATGVTAINVALGDTASLGSTTTGIPLFGDSNQDGTLTTDEDNALSVNLTITSADQLAEVAALSASATSLDKLGIDSVTINLANQILLDTLISDTTLTADLAAIRASGLTINTIDMTTNVGSLTDAQADALVAIANANPDGLSFSAEDTISLQADSGTGTHLSNSLKELQKLGVDSISTASGVGHVSVDFDTTPATSANGSFSTVDLPKFAAGLDVTLHVADTKISQLTSSTAATALTGANIDHLQINLIDAEVGSSSAGFANELSSLLGASGLSNLSTFAPTIDLGGSSVVGQVGISQVQASTLIADGLHFADADSITLDATLTAGNTHLGTSLKDLQKLGVDAVAVTGSDVVSVDLGGLTAADLGTNGHIASFDEALNVTLNVANSAEFNAASDIAAQLHTAHIDSIKIDVPQTDSNSDFFSEAHDLLVSVSSSIEHFSLPDIGIATVLDLGGANVHGALTIDTNIAQGLLDSGISFAANDDVSLQAAAGSTHLASTLKDLQKLGVDSVSVTGAASGADLHVTLGSTETADFGPSLASTIDFADFDDALDVTLDVQGNTTQFGFAADYAAGLHAAHIDNVKFDLLDTGTTGFADDMLALSQNTALAADAAALKTHLVGIELDLGGASQAGELFINESEANQLIAAGVHFSADDHITLNATGTYATAHMADLQKLGVDTHEPIVNSVQLASLSSSLQDAGLHSLDVFDTQHSFDATLLSQLDNFDWTAGTNNLIAPVATAASTDAVSSMVSGGVDVLSAISLDPQATWGDLIETLQDAGLATAEVQTSAAVHISDDLSAALYESGMLHALPDGAIAIDAGANKVLNTSLKAMADLGVDSVNADHKVYVELGLKPEDGQTIADLHDLFAAFSADSATATDLFGNNDAGLVLDQATFEALGTSGVEQLLGDLTKLGFTEVDVMGASAVSAVYEINVTAQTPVLSQVALIGTDATNDLAHVFDPDILNKPIK